MMTHVPLNTSSVDIWLKNMCPRFKKGICISARKIRKVEITNMRKASIISSLCLFHPLLNLCLRCLLRSAWYFSVLIFWSTEYSLGFASPITYFSKWDSLGSSCSISGYKSLWFGAVFMQRQSKPTSPVSSVLSLPFHTLS